MSIYDEICAERTRQNVRWGEQNHTDVTEVGLHGDWMDAESARRFCKDAFAEGRGSWAHILMEELCEAIGATTQSDRRHEVVQLAACCVAWLESIDRARQKDSPGKSRDRWKCPDCGWSGIQGELLIASNPFMTNPLDKIHGCPRCRTAPQFVHLCDEPGCEEASSCGTPVAGGYRRTCGEHAPKEAKP